MEPEHARLQARVRELEAMLDTLVSEDAALEKYTILMNFVLLQAELDRVSKAYYEVSPFPLIPQLEGESE